jgi:hypothetical protein
LNSGLAYSATKQKGCQIFPDTIYQNKGKYTELPQHYQMVIKNTGNVHSLRPSKIDPNWDFLVRKQTIWQPCKAIKHSKLADVVGKKLSSMVMRFFPTLLIESDARCIMYAMPQLSGHNVIIGQISLLRFLFG